MLISLNLPSARNPFRRLRKEKRPRSVKEPLSMDPMPRGVRYGPGLSSPPCEHVPDN